MEIIIGMSFLAGTSAILALDYFSVRNDRQGIIMTVVALILLVSAITRSGML